MMATSIPPRNLFPNSAQFFQHRPSTLDSPTTPLMSLMGNRASITRTNSNEAPVAVVREEIVRLVEVEGVVATVKTE